MKANKFLKRITITGIVIAIMVVVSFSDVSAMSTYTPKKDDNTEHFQKKLENKGYTGIGEMKVSRSHLKDTRYFVTFVSDGYKYEAYFTKDEEIVEVYKISKV